MYLPLQRLLFFSQRCVLWGSVINHVAIKRCGALILKPPDEKKKEYFASWEHLLGQFQSWSGNTTSQIFAAHEHRKCITSRHCRVERTQPAHNLTCCVIHNTNLWGRDDSEDTIIDRDVLFFSRTEQNWIHTKTIDSERKEGRESETNDTANY